MHAFMDIGVHGHTVPEALHVPPIAPLGHHWQYEYPTHVFSDMGAQVHWLLAWHTPPWAPLGHHVQYVCVMQACSISLVQSH
jgi:hypothetical protein